MVKETQQPRTESGKVVVELLIFSGRRNPRWELEPDEAKRLRAILDESRGKEESNPPPDMGLGYSGFAVHGDDEKRGLPPIVVFRGVVSESPGPRGRHFTDRSGVEEFLIDSARGRGHGAVLDHFGVKPFRRRGPPP